MTITRRRWLAGAGLSLLAGLLPAGARALPRGVPTRAARLLGRWPTGNARLFPPSHIAAGLLCAGERSLALIDPARPGPAWSIAHGLPEGAVFRPRATASLAICGGQRALGAWRLADGTPVWKYDAHIQLGVPLVAGEQVYCGDGHELVCLELADGRERWRFAATPDTQISYAPALGGTTVCVGPGDGRLYALDAADGRLRWQRDGLRFWQYLRQLHVSGDILVAGSYQEKLYGIDIATGKQLWEFAAGNFINSHHVAAGVAYLWSPTGWLYAIDVRSGQQRWRLRTTDYGDGTGNWASILAEIASHGSLLFVLDLANVLHLVDTETGREALRVRLPEAVRPFVVPLDERRCCCGASNGDLLLLEA